jgi:hypothetical protein
MGEIKKIVVEHYPVEKLPEDLRAGLEAGQSARVTVEPDGPVEVPPPKGRCRTISANWERSTTTQSQISGNFEMKGNDGSAFRSARLSRYKRVHSRTGRAVRLHARGTIRVALGAIRAMPRCNKRARLGRATGCSTSHRKQNRRRTVRRAAHNQPDDR